MHIKFILIRRIAMNEELRRDIDRLGYDSSFTIYDTTDSTAFI